MKKGLIVGILMGMGLLGVMAVDLTENPLVEVGHFQDVVTKSTPVVDVRAFGATGDGVTDDTAAIQAAIDAADDAGGGVVFVPAGTFLYSGILQIPSYTRLVGTGPASILQPTANTTIRFTGVSRAGIEHLALIRGEVAMSSGIRVLEDSNDIVLRGLYVRRYGQPVHLYDGNDVKVQDCLFEDCTYEVIQQNNYACNRVHVDRCTFRGSGSFSIEGNAADTTDVNDWSVTNSFFLSHRDYPGADSHDGAIALCRVRNCIIANNLFWRIAGTGVIHLEDQIGRAVITGNVFEDCVGGYAYIDILNSSKDTTISNNIFVHTNEALTSYGVRSFAEYYTNDLTVIGNRFIGNAARTFNAVSLSYMSTGRKTLIGNHAELCDTAYGFRRTDNVILSGNTAVNCNTALRASGGNNDDWTVTDNAFAADVNAISVPHDATHPRNRRWVVSGNRCDPNVIAYNAQNWTVYGNQIAAGGTWSLDNGDCQFLRAYLNTTADSEPNLYQPGQTLTAAAVTIGGPSYTPDGWWKMDDTAASTAVTDSSSNGYHMAAQANADTLTTAGVIGTALTFNGTSDYATIGSAPFAAHASGTIMLWVKADNPTVGEVYLFGTADPTVTSRYMGLKLVGTTGKVGVAQRNADTADNLDGTSILQVGEWYHIALASDNSDYFLYLNGKAEVLTATSGSNTGDWLDSVTGAANLSIGAIVRSIVAGFFDGTIDDVRYYSETLTQPQIEYIYRAQRDEGAETFAGTLTVNGGIVSKNGPISAGYIDICPDSDVSTDVAIRETLIIVDLSNAQIKDLADTPVELVPAPGEGKWLELCGASLWLDYGTNGLTEADSPDDLCIEYDNGTGPAASAPIVASGFITAAADTGAFAIPVSLAGTAAASIVNKNLVLVNTGTDYTGNAAEDTVMRVIVRYRVHSGLGL